MIPAVEGLTKLAHVLQRLEHAHRDLTRIAVILREPLIVVATLDPTPFVTPPQVGYQATGWAQHFGGELRWITEWVASEEGQRFRSQFTAMFVQLDAYLEALPRVVKAIQDALDRENAESPENHPMTQAEQFALSDALMAELA